MYAFDLTFLKLSGVIYALIVCICSCSVKNKWLPFLCWILPSVREVVLKHLSSSCKKFQIITGIKHVGQRKCYPSKCFKCLWLWPCRNLDISAHKAKTRLLTIPLVNQRNSEG